MSFDIQLLQEYVDEPEIGNTGQLGEIVLGDYAERFVSLIGFWSPLDYAKQWETGVRRLMEQDRPSCLITSIHDPEVADVAGWWLLYPAGSLVHVQEGLLLFRDQQPAFSLRDPYASIPERKVMTQDGAPISEWSLPRVDFAAYLRRRQE